VIAAAFAVGTFGCSTANPAPLRAVDRPIDLNRFMGDWYVLAHIPIEIPFFSEANAYNGVESYRLTDEGIIETTYRFRQGGFDGSEVVFNPRAWVHDDQTNAEWRMQFVWPFRAAYLIAYVDDNYRSTIIGVPNRRNAWIMSRSPQASDAELAALTSKLVDLGYDTEKLRKVPQQWPHTEMRPASESETRSTEK
jgi:apolipoprotein D and lipocalin family protein